MPSKALTTFQQNQADVNRLLEIHTQLAGDVPGRKYRVEVLNKSAIVLICAYWEAYIEDVVSEALDFLVANAPDVTKLPVELRKFIASEIKKDPHDLSPWKMAGTGWQSVVRTNLAAAKTKHLDNWNTPKAPNIAGLCKQALGLQDLPSAWKWQKCSTATAAQKLNDFVTLRGAIAHRGKAAETVTKWHATEGLALVNNLALKTDDAINRFVLATVGKPLF